MGTEGHMACLDDSIDDAEDNTSEPELEGPLGDPLSSLRVQLDEFNSIGLDRDELAGHRCLMRNK